MENIKNLDNWKLFADGKIFMGIKRSEIGEFIFMLDDYIEKSSTALWMIFGMDFLKRKTKKMSIP